MNIIRGIANRIAAFKRGEKRVAKTATRGRIYDKKRPELNPDAGDSNIAAHAKMHVKIEPKRVYSKKHDRWYELADYQRLQAEGKI